MVTPPRFLERCLQLCLRLAIVVALLPAITGRGEAQEGRVARKDGLYITVPNPITDSAYGNIKERIDHAIKKQKREGIDTIIFDFNPKGQRSGTGPDRFGSCESLANFIRELNSGLYDKRIRTVAFVRNEVSKHTVLPVLACSELVMANDGENNRVGSIGDVLKDDRGEPRPTVLTAYEQVSRRVGRALVFKMLYPNREIRQVKLPDNSLLYLDADEIKKKKDAGEEFTDLGTPKGLELGNPRYDAEAAQKFGLARATYNDPTQVIAAYRLPRQVLTEVWIGDRQMVPGVVHVHGQLDRGKVESLSRRIKLASKKNVNFLILHLDCVGGDTDAALTLAQTLATLKDQTNEYPVRTLAYVPPGRALGAATFLAVACNEIAMGRDAVLGDFDYLKTDADQDQGGRRGQLADLAKSQGYPPAVFEAMLDRNLNLVRVQSRNDPNEYQIVAEQEFLADKKSQNPKWNDAGRIPKPEGEYFKLTAALARELDIVQQNEISSLEELYQVYNVPEGRVLPFRDDWLDKMSQFFQEPMVRLLLIVVGILGMILELKMPGTTLPGIVAAICFVLFFWAHSFTAQYTMLAVLLFVLGLILLGLEIFVFPGFGLPGVTGILLVVGSLVLVTLEKMPSTTQDWVSVGLTLTTFAAGLAVAIVWAFMLAWYLPHIPYANRLVLAPPTDSPTAAEAAGDNPLAALLGAIGVAETPLRPAGKARFGEDFHDVIAEGDFVNPGARVQVIEIEGQRIVVKEV